MLVLSWKLFSQTGNIETYLLHKELERDIETDELEMTQVEDLSDSTFS
ncbi:YqzL family protein [Shouchella patagoniensis]|nr:YqzL family protein [Shouchella patagoniensis]